MLIVSKQRTKSGNKIKDVFGSNMDDTEYDISNHQFEKENESMGENGEDGEEDQNSDTDPVPLSDENWYLIDPEDSKAMLELELGLDKMGKKTTTSQMKHTAPLRGTLTLSPVVESEITLDNFNTFNKLHKFVFAGIFTKKGARVVFTADVLITVTSSSPSISGTQGGMMTSFGLSIGDRTVHLTSGELFETIVKSNLWLGGPRGNFDSRSVVSYFNPSLIDQVDYLSSIVQTADGKFVTSILSVCEGTFIESFGLYRITKNLDDIGTILCIGRHLLLKMYITGDLGGAFSSDPIFGKILCQLPQRFGMLLSPPCVIVDGKVAAYAMTPTVRNLFVSKKYHEPEVIPESFVMVGRISPVFLAADSSYDILLDGKGFRFTYIFDQLTAIHSSNRS